MGNAKLVRILMVNVDGSLYCEFENANGIRFEACVKENGEL